MSRKNRIAVQFSGLVVVLVVALFLFPSGRQATSSSSCEMTDTSSCEHEGSSVLPSGLSAVSAHSTPRLPSDEHETKMLADALRKKPDHAPVLLRMASLAAARREFDTAVAHLRRAVKFEPNNAEARLELGRVLFEKGDTAGAIEETERLLKLDQGNPDALYNLGAIHANLGNPHKAEKYWNQLIASSPDSESGRRAKTMLSELPKESKMASAARVPESVAP